MSSGTLRKKRQARKRSVIQRANRKAYAEASAFAKKWENVLHDYQPTPSDIKDVTPLVRIGS